MAPMVDLVQHGVVVLGRLCLCLQMCRAILQRAPSLESAGRVMSTSRRFPEYGLFTAPALRFMFSLHRKPKKLSPSQTMTGGGVIMKGFVQDIESLAIKNSEFRKVLYTAKHCQLVVMALEPREEIGAEIHKLDQFFRVEEGSGEAVLDGVRTAIRAGFAVVVPAGAKHNIINTGSVPLKLYTLYAPPNHRDGVVHHTRADAEADNEHFDGKTTE
jgi:mannose-6-phosphate isomerase-like protein (cupin superfamily)